MNENNFSFDDALNDQQFNNNIGGEYLQNLDDGGPQMDRPLFQKQNTQNNKDKKSLNKYLEGEYSKSLEHQGNSSSLNNFDSKQLMDLPNSKSQSKYNPIQFNNDIEEVLTINQDIDSGFGSKRRNLGGGKQQEEEKKEQSGPSKEFQM